MAWRYCQPHCNVSERREMDLLYAMVKLHHPLNAIVHFRFYVCLRTRCHSRSKWLHACPWLSCPWPCVNFCKLAMLLKRCLALSRHQNGKRECILAAMLLNDARFLCSFNADCFEHCSIGSEPFNCYDLWISVLFHGLQEGLSDTPDIAFLWNMASLNFTLMIDNTPKIMLHAVNRSNTLIWVPMPVWTLPVTLLNDKRSKSSAKPVIPTISIACKLSLPVGWFRVTFRNIWKDTTWPVPDVSTPSAKRRVILSRPLHMLMTLISKQ